MGVSEHSASVASTANRHRFETHRTDSIRCQTHAISVLKPTIRRDDPATESDAAEETARIHATQTLAKNIDKFLFSRRRNHRRAGANLAAAPTIDRFIDHEMDCGRGSCLRAPGSSKAAPPAPRSAPRSGAHI